MDEQTADPLPAYKAFDLLFGAVAHHDGITGYHLPNEEMVPRLKNEPRCNERGEFNDEACASLLYWLQRFGFQVRGSSPRDQIFEFIASRQWESFQRFKRWLALGSFESLCEMRHDLDNAETLYDIERVPLNDEEKDDLYALAPHNTYAQYRRLIIRLGHYDEILAWSTRRLGAPSYRTGFSERIRFCGDGEQRSPVVKAWPESEEECATFGWVCTMASRLKVDIAALADEECSEDQEALEGCSARDRKHYYFYREIIAHHQRTIDEYRTSLDEAIVEKREVPRGWEMGVETSAYRMPHMPMTSIRALRSWLSMWFSSIRDEATLGRVKTDRILNAANREFRNAKRVLREGSVDPPGWLDMSLLQTLATTVEVEEIFSQLLDWMDPEETLANGDTKGNLEGVFDDAPKWSIELLGDGDVRVYGKEIHVTPARYKALEALMRKPRGMSTAELNQYARCSWRDALNWLRDNVPEFNRALIPAGKAHGNGYSVATADNSSLFS